MLRAIAASCLLLLAPLSHAAGAEDAAVAALRKYHAAFEAGDPAAVTRLLGPGFFMADERTGDRAKPFGAHMFLSGDRLREWPVNYLKEAGPHKNQFSAVDVSIRRDAAVVVTRDTGSNKFRSWKDEETVWFLGLVEDQWRIVGMVIRDFQVPK